MLRSWLSIEESRVNLDDQVECLTAIVHIKIITILHQLFWPCTQVCWVNADLYLRTCISTLAELQRYCSLCYHTHLIVGDQWAFYHSTNNWHQKLAIGHWSSTKGSSFVFFWTCSSLVQESNVFGYYSSLWQLKPTTI